MIPSRLSLAGKQQQHHAVKIIQSKLKSSHHGILNRCKSSLSESNTATVTNETAFTTLAAATATAAALTLTVLSSSSSPHDTSKSDVTCQCESLKTNEPFGQISNSSNKILASAAKNQPRNVMVHRLRSLRGRSLNEKYNVDWKNVLGEGAYGSVYPARLAATGEKVCSHVQKIM